MPIFIYLIFLLLLGFYQVINAFYRFGSTETSTKMHRDLKRYGLIICSYFALGTLANFTSIEWTTSPFLPFFFLYIFFCPLGIAVHYMTITLGPTKVEAPEYQEIEKLIF